MAKYVKKPIPVEVKQYKDESILEWINKDEQNAIIDYLGRLCINTHGGMVPCEKGNYVIKGVEGEFYPIKENIFNKTYVLYKEE